MGNDFVCLTVPSSKAHRWTSILRDLTIWLRGYRAADGDLPLMRSDISDLDDLVNQIRRAYPTIDPATRQAQTIAPTDQGTPTAPAKPEQNFTAAASLHQQSVLRNEFNKFVARAQGDGNPVVLHLSPELDAIALASPKDQAVMKTVDLYHWKP